ncbi:hypothetical protein GFM44_30585 [Rhizobium leguminosarum bv. viciae]|nr:hypothetical protein [Rhizobium leguminosarum bv. viciae]
MGTNQGPCGQFSDELAADGFPLGHGMRSVIANLVGRRFCVIWNEEIANGGEQRNKMLQAPD